MGQGEITFRWGYKMAFVKMTTGKLDIFLILPVLASLMMISDVPDFAETAATLSPIARIAILVPAIVIIGLLAVMGSGLDRRCSEDYIFQLLANAALIGVIVTVMVNMAWGIAKLFYLLPDLSGENMTGITVMSWCAGYYWYRLKGLTS